MLNALQGSSMYYTKPKLVFALQILEGTVATVCREMDALHCLINGIALLDVLQSFATVVGCHLSHFHGVSDLTLPLHDAIQWTKSCSGRLSWRGQHTTSGQLNHQLNVGGIVAHAGKHSAWVLCTAQDEREGPSCDSGRQAPSHGAAAGLR